jgi:hypothetical protein
MCAFLMMPFQSNAWNEQKVIIWVWTKITTKFDHLQSIEQVKLKVLKPLVKFVFELLLKVLKYKKYKQLWITMISKWSMDDMCSYPCSFFLGSMVYTFQTCILIVYYVFDVVFTQLQKTNLKPMSFNSNCIGNINFTFINMLF